MEQDDIRRTIAMKVPDIQYHMVQIIKQIVNIEQQVSNLQQLTYQQSQPYHHNQYQQYNNNNNEQIEQQHKKEKLIAEIKEEKAKLQLYFQIFQQHKVYFTNFRNQFSQREDPKLKNTQKEQKIA